MATSQIATFADMEYQFKLLQHFQKCYLRRENDKAMREMMVIQARKVVNEIKKTANGCPLLKKLANDMIKEYDVKVIINLQRINS